MRAILINPSNQTVTEVEYNGDIEEIYKLIDCTCFTVPLTLENNDALYLDDEGLLKDPQNGFRFAIDDQNGIELVGKCLILGTDDVGASIAAKSNIQDITSRIRWFILVPKV